jgi:hypothetical protein
MYEAQSRLLWWPTTPELLPDILLPEPPCLPHQHLLDLIMAHAPLLLADGNQTFCEMIVVLAHQTVGYLEIVDVSEDECSASDVGISALDEGDRLVAPVAEGIQMMRGVVAVVEAETVRLVRGQKR